MITLRNILVPTDFGDSSQRAELLAIELAKAFGAHVTLLHVWSLPSTAYAEGLSWPVDDLEKAAQSALDQELARVVKLHPDTDGLLRVGPAWERILDVAKERAADLVVMGTHGRHGLPRMFLGSVAEKVVRMSHVPVLTVGAHKEEKKGGKS